MRSAENQEISPVIQRVKPLCPLFGNCGGCSYQDLDYRDELLLKESFLKGLISEKLSVKDSIFKPIIPSPRPYYYRNRLDLKLVKTRAGDVFIGFTPVYGKGILPVDRCYIAREEISDLIEEVKAKAIEKISLNNYRHANLVIRTGDDKRVLWGGIGRRSTRLEPSDYLWTVVNGKRIFYSLDTFFQANLSILQRLLDEIALFDIWSEKTVFYDLYGGVGFFGIGLIHKVKRAVLIEECRSSVNIARHNIEYNKIDNLDIILGRVEDELPKGLSEGPGSVNVAIVDPPRAGLSGDAVKLLLEAKGIEHILYLSCNPDALARDLLFFVEDDWEIKRIIPFDFFPKTRHLETLVLLTSKKVKVKR